MTDKAVSDLWWKNAVIYCADVATWLDSDGDGIGDIAGLTRRLDYLWGLGINTLWMMPFYPSPLGDDGYDITDYYSVDPRFGTLGDFVEMMRTADDLGIRVLVDLVMSHTSDQHPWFQRSRSDPGSRHRHYYRWSDTKQAEPSEVAFPGEQSGTWKYDEAARQWYMHRYYDFMPDLNITDPDVLDEMHKVLGFWLELGISGFRVDSLPFMIETVGTDAKDQPVTYLRSLVEFLERRRGDAIFLGEANVSPEEQQGYFAVDGGDGVQMLFDFRTCAAQWLAHARGDAAPIADALRSRRPHPEQAQFANFCRHHDELNLGLLSDGERDEVFAAFAPEPEHRVYGRGIRRRLAPMLGYDQQRIRMALALTMALPGTPVLLYGDEIGMGEDLSLPGRLAVRNPMQWSPGPGGGFTESDTPYRPVRAGGRPATWPSTRPSSAMTLTRSTPGWPVRSGCAARARNSAGASGASSTSATRMCSPSRPAGARTRWSRCTTCQPSPSRSSCPLTWTSRPGMRACGRCSATRIRRTARARTFPSAGTASAGCAGKPDG